ncbi:hypothetical protein CPB86DRAFT_784524 [Serendipita vermifera]|nr:hypothetical protein CPB86DRAFT_784524 [Serendipita vermifera]
MASDLSQYDEVVIITLLSTQMTNLQLALKGLIEGCIHGEEKKRRTSASLSTQDMQLLCAWYSWTVGNRNVQDLKLVVLIPDLESCNSTVVHDLFHICSNYHDRLPFKFIIGASSPDVMTSMFTRSTRTLISIRKFVMPNAHQKFEALIKETFFLTPGFPSLILSSSTMNWLTHSWTAYHCSLDGLLTHLQLVFMKHFQNPLTSLWTTDALRAFSSKHKGKMPQDSPSTLFMQDIVKALHKTQASANVKDIYSAVDAATGEFRRAIRQAHCAFVVMHETLEYERASSPNSLLPELKISFASLVEMFGNGTLAPVCSKLLTRVKHMREEQLQGLLHRITKPFHLQTASHGIDEVFVAKIDAIQTTLLNSAKKHKDAFAVHPLSEDLTTLLQKLWFSMDTWRGLPLRQVWQTNETEIPIDLVNPSIRSSILSALLQPGGYLLHDLDSISRRVIDPDVCILFSRYIEAGKTINVYDWFETFSQGLDYSHLDPTPKQQRKSKAKPGSKAALKEEEEERKREEAQRRDAYGRFMWSLHELDMLGLLRWTGRGTGKKGAECAGKVVWVTPDPES